MHALPHLTLAIIMRRCVCCSPLAMKVQFGCISHMTLITTGSLHCAHYGFLYMQLYSPLFAADLPISKVTEMMFNDSTVDSVTLLNDWYWRKQRNIEQDNEDYVIEKLAYSKLMHMHH